MLPVVLALACFCAPARADQCEESLVLEAPVEGGFGRAVAESDNLAVVGAPNYDGLANNAGIAFIYDMTGGDTLFELESPQAGRLRVRMAPRVRV